MGAFSSSRRKSRSRALKSEVDTGVLGDVYFGRTVWLRRRGVPGFGGWFTKKELAGGGPLIDLGVHRLDLALWLMGFPEPEWALAGAYNHLARQMPGRDEAAYNVEDMAACMIKFKNGAVLEVEASWASNIGEGELMETRLLGTKGGLMQHNMSNPFSTV
jgi:predicted dehydrogenase